MTSIVYFGIGSDLRKVVNFGSRWSFALAGFGAVTHVPCLCLLFISQDRDHSIAALALVIPLFAEAVEAVVHAHF